MKNEKNLSPKQEKNVSREITTNEMKQVTGGVKVVPKLTWKPNKK